MSQTNETPLLERIASIWGREKESAKATYARLLKRAELDQKPLSEPEILAFGEAMKAASISMELAEHHRELCQKVLSNRPVAAQLQSAKEAATAAQAEWDVLAKKISELQRQQQVAYDLNQDETARFRRAEAAVQTITSCAEQLSKIGITV